MFEWAFLLKKIIAAFCMPLPILVLMTTLAGICFWRRKLALAKCLSFLSVIFFYLISIQVTSTYLSASLETQYPSYQKNDNENLDYVLVLGSSHISDETQPISSLLSSAGLMRLTEGIRVYRLNPGSKLLLSGYSFGDEISHAEALKRVASHFGVPERDMILQGQVKDTQEEATYWTRLAKGKKMALVTSASHMPRSMYLFNNIMMNNNAVLKIIPAPTDYMSHQGGQLMWKDWFPSGRNIYNVERAWHEYLGLLWARLVS